MRFLGTFLTDLSEVPKTVVTSVASQLDLPTDGPALFARYQERDTTRREHAAAIRRRYGYRRFTGQPGHFRLVRWLFSRAWLSAERPSVLFDLATARLTRRKILLPSMSVLARLVAGVRNRAAQRLYDQLARLPDQDQTEQLESLLDIEEGEHTEPARCAPVRVSSAALVRALNRLEEIRKLGIGDLDASVVPPQRREALARHGTAAWARPSRGCPRSAGRRRS